MDRTRAYLNDYKETDYKFEWHFLSRVPLTKEELARLQTCLDEVCRNELQDIISSHYWSKTRDEIQAATDSECEPFSAEAYAEAEPRLIEMQAAIKIANGKLYYLDDADSGILLRDDLYSPPQFEAEHVLRKALRAEHVKQVANSKARTAEEGAEFAPSFKAAFDADSANTLPSPAS